MKAAVDLFIVDASVAVAWCFPDESNPVSERALDLFFAGAEAIVPAMWPLEVANALLIAERRKRLSRPILTALLDRIASFAVTHEPVDAARAFGQVLSLAQQHALTEYDAAYLELALRRALPLSTLDNDLRRAARRAGVPLL
jgi:predicted nucleic acid-binding protein